MSLDSLPNVVISRVGDFLDPPSHLQLARASKGLLSQCAPGLSTHRRNHVEFRECSDLGAQAFRPLLETIRGDSRIGWHVRSLEVWRHQPLLRGSAAVPSTPAPADHGLQISDLFDRYTGERGSEPNITGEDWGSSAPDEANMEWQQILLFLGCPELKSIKFFGFRRAPADVYARVRSKKLHHPEKHPYNYFVTAVRIGLTHYLRTPPFLKSLRHITIVAAIDAVDVLPLFRLPQLKSLYLSMLNFPQDESTLRDAIKAQYITRQSSVEHLFLEQARWHNDQGFLDLLHMPRRLKTLVLSSNREPNVHGGLTECEHTPNLEVFLPLAGLHDAQKPATWTVTRVLSKFENLRTMVVDVRDLGFLLEPRDRQPGNQSYVAHGFSAFAGIYKMKVCKSLEVLIFEATDWDEKMQTKHWREIGQYLTRLLEQRVFPNLKALYIDKIGARLRKHGSSLGEKREIFENVKLNLERCGVRMYGWHEIGATDAYVGHYCADVFGLTMHE